MSYLQLLPILLISALIIIRVLKFNQVKAHVEKVYPAEWSKLCTNKMKMRKSVVIWGNLEESLKRGFLSQQDDPALNSFKRFDKSYHLIAITLITLNCIVILFK